MQERGDYEARIPGQERDWEGGKKWATVVDGHAVSVVVSIRACGSAALHVCESELVE